MRMSTTLILASLLGISACAGAATAQTNCGPREDVIQHLGENYQESVGVRAVTVGGEMLEILNSPETGSWTALLTKPNGVACLVSSGQGFHFVENEPLGEDM